MMAGSLWAVQFLALCALCYAVPPWVKLAQTSQAYPLKQTSQQWVPAQQQTTQQGNQNVQNPVKVPPRTDTIDKCDVGASDQVLCGPPHINASDCAAINCCYDGQNCYYGLAVTVQCIRDGQFVVVVGRDVTVPRLSLDSFSFLGGSTAPCAPVGSTPSFAIYQFPVTACGTVASEGGGYIVYENRMISSYEVGVGPLGSITRDSHFELLFQCRYTATAVEAVIVEVNTVPPPPPVAALGPLRMELRLGNGQWDEAYSSYYTDSDYPITKVLREPVYVEVHVMERTDPNVVLMLGDCWATSHAEPLSTPRWSLLENGCPYQDDRYLTTLVTVKASSSVQFPTHYKRFMVKMFTFVDQQSMTPVQGTVFIHCSAEVCHSSSGACQQSCARKRRDVDVKTISSETVLVSSGQVNLVM
ncbi:hypothetical protein DNTS_015237 [Danionella cerebrum]|uniref:Zona pellucida sperm-binding protein 4 n=1 Tax=Danionella cerebrum TaxID=2873325 RepID=A0A553MSG1_9TELE|nr:hypothetical protein DNTS_015237 [Danionella translucida]